jgi:hypothetical protein
MNAKETELAEFEADLRLVEGRLQTGGDDPPLVRLLEHERDNIRSICFRLRSEIHQERARRRYQRIIAKTAPKPDERKADNRPPPPAFAEWLIPLLVKGKRSDAILGDLQERFVRDCRELDEQRARRLYVARVVSSSGPLLWSAVKKAGIFAAVAAVARKYLSG